MSFLELLGENAGPPSEIHPREITWSPKVGLNPSMSSLSDTFLALIGMWLLQSLPWGPKLTFIGTMCQALYRGLCVNFLS